jgi:hypothetical protein
MANLKKQYVLTFENSMRKKVNICQARRYEFHSTGLQNFQNSEESDSLLTFLVLAGHFAISGTVQRLTENHSLHRS